MINNMALGQTGGSPRDKVFTTDCIYFHLEEPLIATKDNDFVIGLRVC